MKKIKKRIKAELKELNVLENNQSITIYGVGGSVRATRKLYNEVFGQTSDNAILEASKIKELLSLIKEDKKCMMNRILRLVPERIHTIVPGMIILNTIAQEVSCNKLCVSDYGVRDGYLYSNTIPN